MGSRPALRAETVAPPAPEYGHPGGRYWLAMRVLLAILALTGPAVADPKSAPPPGPDDAAAKASPDDLVVIPFKTGAVHLSKNPGESWVEPPKFPGGKPSGGLAFGGGWALGIVVDPRPNADRFPWPSGGVIIPPDPHDPMAIKPGTDGLGPRWEPRSYTGQIAQGLHEAIGKLFQIVVPKQL